jgi:hypothetical protein
VNELVGKEEYLAEMQNKVSKQELADSLPDMDKYKVEITQLIC